MGRQRSQTIRHVRGEERQQTRIADPPFQTMSLPDDQPWMELYRRQDTYLVRFPGTADFEISKSGSEVRSHPVPGASPEAIEHLYLNQAYPLALSLQMKLVLHGSAVEIDGQALAFLGESGRGKSTLAVRFIESGCRFLADDAVVIEQMASGYLVRSGHPSIRLWADSLAKLLAPLVKRNVAIDHDGKARLILGDESIFCTTDRPLAGVYILGEGEASTVSIAPIAAKPAMIELVRHSFMLGVDERSMLEHNFNKLAELCRRPLFFSLDYPRRYDVLDEVYGAILRHLSERS